MKLPKLEDFLERLQKSWNEVKKFIEIVQKNIKKQFNKKRKNSQELKVRENMWLEAKNIYSNRPSKKLD